MDDDQEIEALFADDGSVSLAFTPVPKSIVERFGELHISGCRQKITWSKTGCVAYITSSGHNVGLRPLVKTLSDGQLVLGEEFLLLSTSELETFQSRLVHLEWNTVGSDLAVVDEDGRIDIHNARFTLGNMISVRKGLQDPDDAKGTVVGFHWLPASPNQPKCAYLSDALRKEDNWMIGITGLDRPGLFNPVEGNPALVCATSTGLLRLLYRRSDQSYLEVTVELEGLGSSADFFTHASFAPDTDRTLALVVHDMSGQLRLYRVHINWNTVQNPRQAKDLGESSFSMAVPTLHISHLGTQSHCAPQRSSAEDGYQASPRASRDRSLAQLAHLVLLPAAPEQQASTKNSITVIACFTFEPCLIDQMQPISEAYSVLAQWNIETQVQELHPAWGLLASRKKQSDSAIPTLPMKTQFCRRPDITTADSVLSIHHSWPDNKVMLVRTDGSVEFRYRDTMDIITADYNDSRVINISQAGFIFLANKPSAHIALSPNACMTATMGEDDIVHLSTIQYTQGSLSESGSEQNLDPGPALVALALQHATSCYYQQDNDDVLAALPPYLPLNLRFKFLHALYNFARISVDYVSVENQKQAPRILSNTIMVRVMSAQNTLGFTNDRKHQDPSGKIAWMILNLRSVVLNLRFAVPPREPSPPDTVRSLLRVVKWTLDLMCYVFRIVLDLWQHQRHADDKLLWRKKVFEWNTPGLVLIFSSIPRCLFRFILPYLITLFKQSHEAQSPSCLFIKTVKQRQIWKTLLAQFDSMPFQLAHFQNLLNEVDTAVRSAYAAAGILAEPQRHAVEKAMLIDGTIPAVLAPAVQRLLQPDVFLDALVRESSFSALDILFYDTAWLGLHDEPSHTKKRMFDVLKKTPLPEGTMARKCTRCGSLMEELPSPPQGSTQAQPTLVEPPRIPNWIVANQRTCICGNHWVLAKWEARRGR